MIRHRCYEASIAPSGSQQITSFFHKVHKKEDVAVSKYHKNMVSESCLRFVVQDIRPMKSVAGDGLINLLSTFTVIGARYGELSVDQIKQITPSERTVSATATGIYFLSESTFTAHNSNAYSYCPCYRLLL